MTATNTSNRSGSELATAIDASVARQRKYAVALIAAILVAGLGSVWLVLTQVQDKLELLKQTQLEVETLVAQKKEREGEIREVEARLQRAAADLKTVEQKIAEANSKLQSAQTGQALKEALSRTEAIRSGIETASGTLSTKTQSRSNASYSVSLFVMSSSDDERLNLNSHVQSLGYRLAPTSFTVTPGASYGWFAKQPTVFYYSQSSAAAARELAKVLKAKTGRDFAVQIGSGLNVSAEERLSVFVVHLPG